MRLVAIHHCPTLSLIVTAASGVHCESFDWYLHSQNKAGELGVQVDK